MSLGIYSVYYSMLGDSTSYMGSCQIRMTCGWYINAVPEIRLRQYPDKIPEYL